MYILQKTITYDEAQKAFDRLNSLINVTVGAANTIAGRCLYDAHEMLRHDKKLYRQQTKQYANEAVRCFQKYERYHIRNFGDRYRMFLDYLDSIEDNVMPHVDKLYWSIKALLDKNNEPGSALKAHIETAHTMIDFACHVYDTLLENTRRETALDFRRLMRPARLTGTFCAWQRLTSRICHSREGADINLNADPNCVLAFEIIERILTSEDTMNLAGYEALKLNPELVRELAPEDYEELKEHFEKDN